MTNQRPLPKLADLHHDPDMAFKDDEYLRLLNSPPSAHWLKTNKYANNAQYLPIDKVEFFLDYIFQSQWKVEVLSKSVMLNAIEVTIRLHYKHPVTGEWMFHDGTGAKNVELQQGAQPFDLTKITVAAVEKALPTAKSKAIRDAADHLGRLFGRDLNRKDTVGFEGSYSAPVQPVAPAPPTYPVSQPQQWTPPPPTYQEPDYPPNQHYHFEQPKPAQDYQYGTGQPFNPPTPQQNPSLDNLPL